MRNIAGRLAQLFPRARHARMIRSWAGVIENTPDGRPVIDRPAGFDNLVLASLSSIGFGLSPATGHGVRDLVLDGHCDFADLSSFALSRFDQLEPDWQDLQGWRANSSSRLPAASQIGTGTRLISPAVLRAIG